MDLAAFRARFAERTVNVRGRKWGLIDGGTPAGRETPPILFLPGTLGTADIFWNQIAAFRDERPVLAVTYAAVADVGTLADDVARLLDRLRVARVDLLGTSLGGFVAQAFCIRHADRVATLFVANSLSDPGPLQAKQPPAWQVAAMPATALRRVMRTRIQGWSTDQPELAPLVELLEAQLAGEIGGRALKARVLAMLRARALPPLPFPDERIVIIESADDPLIPEPVRAEVRRRYPGAVVHRFDRGGHFPYVTRPEDYTALLRKHLTRPT